MPARKSSRKAVRRSTRAPASAAAAAPDGDAYPRPLMRRGEWMNLNGTWRFGFDAESRYAHPGQIERWPLQIRVPFPPESRASGIGDTSFHRSCWYERDFDLVPGDGRVLLHFGAVDY